MSEPLPTATLAEFHAVLASVEFAVAVGTVFEHTDKTGNEGGFTLQRRAGHVVISALHTPLHASQNKDMDPRFHTPVIDVVTAVGNFHSHPYDARFGPVSPMPSPRDMANVGESSKFAAGHVHGVFGREWQNPALPGILRMMRRPPEADWYETSQITHKYAFGFMEARHKNQLGKFLNGFGVGFAAVHFTVHGGRASFNFDNVGGADAVASRLYRAGS